MAIRHVIVQCCTITITDNVMLAYLYKILAKLTCQFANTKRTISVYILVDHMHAYPIANYSGTSPLRTSEIRTPLNLQFMWSQWRW